MGVAKAAKQLGLHKSQLYAWHKQSKQVKTVSDGKQLLTFSTKLNIFLAIGSL
jgi:transposase-like protein